MLVIPGPVGGHGRRADRGGAVTLNFRRPVDANEARLPNGVIVIDDVDPDKMAKRKKPDPAYPNDYDLLFTGGAKSLRVELHLGDVASMRRQAHAIMKFARQVDEICNTPKLDMARRLMQMRQAHSEVRATNRELSATQELHMRRGWDETK